MKENSKFSMQLIQLIALVVLALILLPLIYIGIGTTKAPPLQDEFYILSMFNPVNLGQNFVSQSFLDFKGVEATDTFGVVSALILKTVSSLSVSISTIRTLSLFIHIANTVLVYLVMTKALSPKPASLLYSKKINWLPFLIAFCFALYPITVEAVFWIGGLAYTLGLTFLLTSYLLYFLGKENRSWKLILFGASLYLVALFTDTSLWSASFVIVGLELARNFIGPKSEVSHVNKNTIEEVEDIEDAVDKLLEAEKNEKVKTESKNQENNSLSSEFGIADIDKEEEENVFDTLLPALPYLGLGAIVPLGGLPTYGTEPLGQEMIIQAGDWLTAIKAFWFPINESITIGYNKQYAFLKIIYALGIAAVPFALARSKAYRQHVIFILLWLLMACVPHLHHIISNDTMAGSRWFYHASIPISCLTVLFFSAISFIEFQTKNKKQLSFKIFSTVFSITMVTIVIVFMFTKTRSQLRAHKVAAKLVENLRLSIKTVSAKENFSSIIVRNVPENATVTNQTSPFNLILFDGKSQLIEAPHIVGGKLKDKLKNNQLQKSTFFFEHHSRGLYPVELGTINNSVISNLPASEIRGRIIPPIYLLPSTKFDQSSNLIKISSAAKAGPVLTISANGFDPLGPDFVYLDAKIDLPRNPDNNIELVWNTTWGKNLERRDRISSAKVISSKNQFSRYYFPVRSTAWSTNGKIQTLSFIFPPEAKIEVKEIGQINSKDRIPSLNLVNSTNTVNKQFFSSGLYSYPNQSTLGLQTVFGKDKDLEFEFDATNCKGATKVICEIGRLNKFFNNPNGSSLSEDHLKILHLSNLEGKIIVKSKILSKNGIYSFRIFATDNKEKIVGNSSDAVCCLVDNSLTFK